MSEANSTRSSARSILPAWRGAMTHNNHRSQERHDLPQEISRWSKTTTESEASEAFTRPKSPAPSPSPAKKTRVLKKKLKQRKRSKDTTASSPVDPCYDPKTKTLGLPGKTQPPAVVGPITGPDEPRSFYDSGSDDSSDAEPVLQRASSVRVSKPFIVQHSNNSGGSVPKFYVPQTPPAGDGTLVPKPLNLGHQLMNASGANDSVAEDQLQPVGGPADALKSLEGREPGVDALSAVSEATSEASTSQASTSPRDTLKRTILEFPSPPVGNEGTDTLPTPMGGFGSLRTSKTTSDAGYSTSTYVASIDGLRSNPITDFDKKLSRAISAPARHPARRVTIRPSDLVINRANNDHKLFRESIVSTPYPARQNSMVEFDEQPAPQVVTPRQLRRSRLLLPNTSVKETKSIDEKQQTIRKVADETLNEENLPPKIPLSTKPTIPGATSFVTPRSDRFPSPAAPEVLFLNLRLGRHPSARVTVEIEIDDKPTFDDEQLFTIIRKSCDTKLLGLVRGVLSARRLSHVGFSSMPNDSDDINTSRSSPAAWSAGHGHARHLPTGANDFARHLLRPSLGHRRKIWLLWLRDQQHPGLSSRQQRRAARTAIPQIHQTSPLDEGEGESPVAFSFMHPRNNSHSPSQSHDVSPTTASAAPKSTALNGGGGGSALSRQASTAVAATPTPSRPSITIPRMPFQPFHLRDKSTSSTTSSTTTTPTPTTTSARKHSSSTSTSTSTSHPHSRTSGPPTLYLHYTFSLPRITAVFALILTAAVFTTTMWILFGVPGRSVAQGDGTGAGEYGGDVLASWRHDAHKRVGVGFLLGFVVAVLGLVTETLWVWGSWVLV